MSAYAENSNYEGKRSWKLESWRKTLMKTVMKPYLSQNGHDNACHERFHGFAHELWKNHHNISLTDREDNYAKWISSHRASVPPKTNSGRSQNIWFMMEPKTVVLLWIWPGQVLVLGPTKTLRPAQNQPKLLHLAWVCFAPNHAFFGHEPLIWCEAL